MIGTIAWISWIRLRNNWQELVLVFVVPVTFFTVFAFVFTKGIGGDAAPIALAIVDEDQSRWSEELVKALQSQTTLKVRSGFVRADHPDVIALGRDMIRSYRFDQVLYVPPGVEYARRQRETVTLRILDEGTNPIARQMTQSLIRQAMAKADVESGMMPTQRPPQTPLQRLPATPDTRPLPVTRTDPASAQRGNIDLPEIGIDASPKSATGRSWGDVAIEEVDLFGQDQENPKVAMYAAGIAVMFLLFSTTGAGGSLLEELEAGTLERLLQSRLTLTELLAGKWTYITLLGCLQVTVMFTWAQLVFQVDLIGHLTGFVVMTVATSAATASLALCLAVLCRSRAQLTGISVVLILTMSALGGSMIPRYLMSDSMQRWGRLTFNAWAIDGYQKVFWYDLPISALKQELAVMTLIAVYLAIVARLFAERWKTA